MAEEPADLPPDDSTDVIALVRFVVAAAPADGSYDDFLTKRIEFFRDVPGLKRKYYTDGGEPGLSIGVYHWDSRDQALDYYNDAWHADMEARMESYSLEIVDVEIIQDNEADQVTRF
jgi:hypothetical protein